MEATERTLSHGGIMLGSYLLTCVLGSCLLYKEPRPNLVHVQPSGAAGPETVPPWITHRGLFLSIAFLSTFVLCVTTSLAALATGNLSKQTGLAWEFYSSIFACGCVWLLLQAVMARRWMPCNKRYGASAFVEASISGVLPFLSDAFDTLKDVMFGVICLESEKLLVKALGVLTWLWLVLFHFILMRDQHCRLELAGNHLSVLALQWEDLQKAKAKEKGCWAMMAMACPIFYKQLTPAKRKMLVVENVPQAALAIIYLALQGDSALVAVLNLAVPLAQILLTYVLFWPIQLLAAKSLAKRLDAAVNSRDAQLLSRLLNEARLGRNSQLLLAMMAHSRSLQELTGTVSGEERSSMSYPQLARYGHWCEECLKGMCSEDLRLDARCLIREHGTELGDMREDETELAIAGFLRMNLPSPWYLVLDDCRISDYGAELLAEGLKVNQTLRMLTMDRNPLGYRGLKVLGQSLLEQKGLVRLHLDECAKREPEAEAEMIEVLVELIGETESLTSFSFANNHISAESMQELVAVVRFSPMRDLFLRRLEPPRDIQDQFLGREQPPKDEALARFLCHCYPLDILDLSQMHINDDFCEVMASVVRAKKVQEAQKEKALMKVENLGTLEVLKWPVSLRLNGNPLTSRGVEALISAAATAELWSLEIFEMKNKWKSQALAEALALRLYGFSLDLSGCDMGDDLLKLLAFALQLAQDHKPPAVDVRAVASLGRVPPKKEERNGHGLRALDVLDLKQNKLSPASGQVLASCLKGSLRHLALGYNSLGAPGCKALAVALQSHPNLKVLELERNQLQDEGVQALVEVHCGQLERLNLSGNDIGDKGGQALAKMLPGSRLHVLDLSQNAIGERGGEAWLDALKQPHQSFKQLNLSQNRISIELGAAISALLREKEGPLSPRMEMNPTT